MTVGDCPDAAPTGSVRTDHRPAHRPHPRGATPVRRRRWRALRRVLFAVGVGVILLVGALQLQQVPWGETLSQASWQWVLVAAAMSAVSYVGAAWNVTGFSPPRIGLVRAVLAQAAGAALKIITPAGVGALAVNVRLVQKAGASARAAVTAIAGAQGAQFLVSVLCLGVLVVLPGPRVDLPEVPDSPVVWVAAGLGVVVLAGVLAVLWSRRGPVWEQLGAAVAAIRAVVVSPRRFAEGFGGGLLLTLGFIGAMWASLLAFGGQVSPLGVAVVVLVGTGVGSVVPTPGGAGAIEVSLTGGLVAVGAPVAVAVPAVLVYRLLTFWLPMLLGVGAAARLRAVDAL